VPRAWRLLVDGEASGPWNMGVDEALLASAIADGRSTLRLYRWNGPWLSLGYGHGVEFAGSGLIEGHQVRELIVLPHWQSRGRLCR